MKKSLFRGDLVAEHVVKIAKAIPESNRKHDKGSLRLGLSRLKKKRDTIAKLIWHKCLAFVPRETSS